MKFSKILILLLVLLLSAACGSGLSTAESSTARGAQDIWLYGSILKTGQNGEEELLPAIIEEAKRDLGPAIELRGGFFFRETNSIHGEISDETGETIEGLELTFGILEFEGTDVLIAFSTPQPGQGSPNVDLDDLVVLDLTFLDNLQPGDTVYLDYAFAQTLDLSGSDDLSIQNPVDILEQRWEAGQIHAPAEVEDGELYLLGVLNEAAEVVDGSTKLRHQGKKWSSIRDRIAGWTATGAGIGLSAEGVGAIPGGVVGFLIGTAFSAEEIVDGNFYLFFSTSTPPPDQPTATPRPVLLVTGYTWIDSNSNGIREGTEAPLGGVLVEIIPEGANTPTAQTTTNAEGQYSFTNLPSGSYRLAFSTPATFEFTLKDRDPYDQLDSDPFPSGTNRGFTEPYMLLPGGAKVGIDAGFVSNTAPTLTPSPTPVEVGQLCPPTIDVFVSISDDPGGHGSFIGMPFTLQLIIECGSITISGPFPWVKISGDIDDLGNFSASGSGTVAGYEGIAVSMSGSLQDGELIAQYRMGINGGLPGGQAITYNVQGQAPQAEDLAEASTEAVELVEQFAEQLEAYNHAADAESLVDALHPEILGTYGEQACLVHAGEVADATLDIEVVGVYGPATWEFTLDGVGYAINDVYTVDAVITRNGQSSATQTHFGLVNGTLSWFTDCGDPLP